MTDPPDRPRRSRLSAAERRASIVAAATEVFSEVGYQCGTMSEVARRVGVSEPVIFQNYGSKAAVFVAVLQEAMGRMTESMQERAAANESVGAWLSEFLAPEHLSRVHGGDSHHVLFADAMSHTSEPLVKEAIRRAHRTVARTLADLLARGQVEGSVRRELDPQTGAWWLLSLLASQGFRTATMPNRVRLEVQLGAMTLQALTTDRGLPSHCSDRQRSPSPHRR
ncbi:MAG: TetR/AcrR family transcriptional regulator [Actinomycetota bacterium]|nr:TetR/AcrR family transcriptional regulator [Actinomycetota bacterium]